MSKHIDASGMAIFHDNLAQMGGAERATQVLTDAMPGAALHTTLAAPWRLVPALRDMDIQTTWMRYLPAPDRLYRHYFLLYPFAIETVDLSSYDLVVSCCFGYAKGIKTRADAVHVCYCHTPMRWVWRFEDYTSREHMGAITQRVLPWLIEPLRLWDLRAAKRPDYFVANSQCVADRIQAIYGRSAHVIYPPIDVARFRVSADIDDFYLVVSRLVPYKRIDLAIEACNLLKRRLVVIGEGPDRARLERLAGPTIEFQGRQSDAVVTEAMARCRAIIFAGEEDFGMVPLEANASGRPVVAWYGGGVLETVREGETGVFFREPTVESVAAALEAVEAQSWDARLLRRHAERFDRSVFIEKMRAFLSSVAPSLRTQRGLAGAHA